MEYDLIVVGGGAAGMMAAVQAGRLGKKVLLLERGEKTGRKLLITGKGRCNVTNNCDRETLLANIPENPRFLYSAFSRFDTQDTMAFFEDAGVPLKTERGNRVFPVTICCCGAPGTKSCGIWISRMRIYTLWPNGMTSSQIPAGI